MNDNFKSQENYIVLSISPFPIPVVLKLKLRKNNFNKKFAVRLPKESYPPVSSNKVTCTE